VRPAVPSKESPLSPAEPSGADTPSDVTGLLLSWSGGDEAAGERLLLAVYAELHRQAERAMWRERGEHTLQATALIHEAYLRLVDQRQVEWRNRAHFFGIAASMMRRVLVDHARARLAEKRGGDFRAVTLECVVDADLPSDDADASLEVLALHEALERLAELDPLQARLVELRYFGGMNIEETATTLGISPATVKREWTIARAWLRRELAMS
jgi:RNA polymerase sigma factor (TIGR02999 family)